MLHLFSQITIHAYQWRDRMSRISDEITPYDIHLSGEYINLNLSDSSGPDVVVGQAIIVR